MQIVSISRGSNELGAEFARNLAGKLGYECISREDLLEEATRQRIPVGKIETAIVKPHVYSEHLALEMEHYKALATSILCEKALDHDIVYHGRTGHLLLPGVDNILRIRVVTSTENETTSAMSRLNLPRKKARQYIEAVEEDRRKWVKKFYNVDWDVLTLYDFVVSLDQVNASNAATAVCHMAQLPEFQSTPASINVLKDLQLAANARLALFRNEKTRYMNLKIMANKGVLNVTYSFQYAKYVADITEALQALTTAKEVVCTEAETSLLWIQGSFDPKNGAYEEVLTLANTWDAAVELIRLTPAEDLTSHHIEEETGSPGLGSWPQSGIVDEEEDMDSREPSDISRIYEKLITDGRAGGKRIIEGSQKSLLNAIDRSREYRLIILDDVFPSKTAETRKRLTREWANALSDNLKTPVVSLDEIRTRYHFGTKQTVRMVILAMIVALTLYLVLHYDDQVMAFLIREGTSRRVLATVCILFFVPVFAFVYGSVASLFLRMMKLD
jgi:cytidylate kinase